MTIDVTVGEIFLYIFIGAGAVLLGYIVVQLIRKRKIPTLVRLAQDLQKELVLSLADGKIDFEEAVRLWNLFIAYLRTIMVVPVDDIPVEPPFEEPVEEEDPAPPSNGGDEPVAVEA